MGRKVKTLKHYTTEQIMQMYKKNKDRYLGVKLLAVALLSRGISSRRLMDIFGVSFKQLCNWADRLDNGGVEGLKIQNGRGRNKKLTDAQISHLKDVLSDSPKSVGYNTANWSGPLLKDYINRQLKVIISLSATYTLLHQLGFTFQRAKAYCAERDEEKRSEIKSDIKKN